MSMQNNLRSFVEQKLQGVVVWERHVKTLNDGSRDHAAIEINVPIPPSGREVNHYRITVTSAYIEPPLGRVVFHDLDRGEEFSGNISDATWKRISDHIRRSSGFVTEHSIVDPGYQHSVASVLQAPVVAPDGRVPHMAQPIVYFTNPGEAVAGLSELAAFVTRVVSPLAVDLVVFPPASEPFHRENVPRRVGANSACRWDFQSDEVSAPKSEDDVYGLLDQAMKDIDELKAKVETLEAKRGPGRPPKEAA